MNNKRAARIKRKKNRTKKDEYLYILNGTYFMLGTEPKDYDLEEAELGKVEIVNLTDKTYYHDQEWHRIIDSEA